MNIPPKSLKMQLAGAGTRTAGASPNTAAADLPGDTQSPALTPNPSATRKASPALRQAGALANKKEVTTDSLPVLQAFQEFIEAERRHSRRQIMVVTSFFLLLFVMISGAAAFFGYVYFSQLNDEIAILRTEVSMAGTSMKKDTSEMLASLARRTDALSESVMDSDSFVQIASSQISSTVSNALAARQEEIDKIRNALIVIHRDNLELKKKFISEETIVPDKIPLPKMADSGPALQEQPLPGSDASGKTQRIIPRIAPPSSDALEIAILAPGSNEPVKWRIPIAE